MSRRAQLPDGTILEFPDGTADAVMDKAVKSHLGPSAPKDDSALNAVVLGAKKPFDNAAKWLATVPGFKQLDQLGSSMGAPTAQQASDANDKLRANNSRTGYATLGNIIGTGAIQAATRGKGGALVQGAGSGALLSDAKTPEGVAIDSGIGALGSKAGQMLANGAAYLAKPVVSKASRLLNDAGIPQTLGQIASQGKSLGAKVISGAEEKLTSVPLLGDLINNARGQGTEAFNVALGNRVLSNIGEQLPKGTEAGTALVDQVGKRLSAKYTALVPKLTGTFDPQFVADLTQAKAMTKTLPNGVQSQFRSIVDDVFSNRANGKTISGQELKDAESKLTFLKNRYAKSMDGDQNGLADAIDRVRQGLRSMVARSNPDHAAELQALNKGWAQLGQMRTAANAAGNSTGVITPAQALAASRKSGFSDEFVKAAKTVLPNKTPDSGTTGRAAMGLLATGGAAGLSSAVSPAMAAPAAIATLYTKPGMKALNTLVFAPRSKLLGNTSEALRLLGKTAPGTAPALLKQDR